MRKYIGKIMNELMGKIANYISKEQRLVFNSGSIVCEENTIFVKFGDVN